jgi:hypothetical protein
MRAELDPTQERSTSQSQQFLTNLKNLLLDSSNYETVKSSFLQDTFAVAKTVTPSPPYQPNWLAYADQKEPIRQFMPAPDRPEFHAKLRAIAQDTLSETIGTTAIVEMTQSETESLIQKDSESE